MRQENGTSRSRASNRNVISSDVDNHEMTNQQGNVKSYNGTNTNRKSLIISKSEGISVIWKNMRVTARIPHQGIFKNGEYEYKEIIHDVTGCVKPCSLVAIMGASGSGKSSFMSSLANRHPYELHAQGNIYLNGKRVKTSDLKRLSGYVYQDDLFISSLTVTEHLNLAAQLRLDCRLSVESRKKLIDNLLIDVGLYKCKDSAIGSTAFGAGKVHLSGGEQKRLSVATELLTNPSLLFCDEPTTGLDSFSAMKLISVMQDLTTRKHKTIICSIHQPSEQIFSLFDQVILLYSGRIAFSGCPFDAVDFFKGLGYDYGQTKNPAEFLVKNLAVVPGQELDSEKKSFSICNEFGKSTYAKKMHEFIENEIDSKDVGLTLETAEIKRHSWFIQFFLLFNRNAKSIIRDPSIQGMTIVYKTILGLIIGLCLMGSCTLTQEGIQSMKGALFSMVAENCFGPCYSAMEKIPRNLPIFTREYANNMNTPAIFYLSTILALTPGFIIDSAIFAIVSYLLIGLTQDFSIFSATVLINVLVMNISSAFGILLSSATSTLAVGQMLALPIDVILMSCAGLFASLRTVPFYFYWIRFVSWITLPSEALLILHLQGKNITCSDNLEEPCLSTGEQVLEQMDYSVDHLPRNIITLVVIYFVMHALGYFFFVLKVKKRRNEKTMCTK